MANGVSVRTWRHAPFVHRGPAQGGARHVTGACADRRSSWLHLIQSLPSAKGRPTTSDRPGRSPERAKGMTGDARALAASRPPAPILHRYESVDDFAAG